MVFYVTKSDRSLSNSASLYRNFETFAPAADVEESNTHYDLSFDMPGINKDDLNVEVEGRTLTVSGQRARNVTENKLHRSEKFFGEYRRSFTLPENFKADEVEATYDNGVLNIRLPKIQASGAKRIDIGTKLPQAVS